MPTLVRLKQKGVRLLRRPERLWGVVLLLALIVFVVIPLFYIAIGSFQFDSWGPRYVRGAKPGDFTLFYWHRVLLSRISTSIFWEPFLHSLLIACLVVLISLPLGGLFAWLVVRTDLPFKNFFNSILVVPYILPAWTLGLAWLTVFKNPQFGGQPGLLYGLFGVEPPVWISYGLLPIVISLSVHYIPYTFILLSGALATIDAQLEESAEILGANRATILRKVTFPLVLPALGSAFILTVGRTLGAFGAPAFLGLPVHYYTLSTRVYAAFSNRQQAEGYVLTVLLILFTTLTVLANQKLLGTRRRFTTITGKGGKQRLVKLGRWKAVALSLMLGFVVLFVFAPLILVLLETFLRVEGQYGWDNLTLHYWIGLGVPELAEGQPGIFRNSVVLGAIKNTVFLALMTALISGVLGVLIGYTVVRNRGKAMARALESLSFVPYMIPGIAFGGIYLSLFARSWGPLPALYGTMTILILTCTMRNLPFAAGSGVSAMHQIDVSLEEAAELHGTPWAKRFFRIILPLTKSGFLSAFILTFITAMRALDEIALLVTPQTRTMTSIIFRFQQQSFTQHAYGITVLIVTITLFGNYLARRLGGRVSL
ncbi:MAG: ABC transporter permease [Candidatus Bipolaricaulaceae bacterium]